MSAALRDRFFALSTGTAPHDEAARYRAEVDATHAEPATAIDGLAVSWHPTARFKAVRFVDADHLDAAVRDLFARPARDAPHLAAVFADPRELSFRTYENIVPLDRIFADTPLDLALTDPAQIAPGVHRARLHPSQATRTHLDGLDALDLYVPPLNPGSRGGERFVFHSALLADALTRAVTAALPAAVLDGFSHVNPVFRCNRFEPGDAPFHSHRDTPYYDAARGHASRHTLLIYLTGGTGTPALDLAGTALTRIDPYTCIVFDQRHEHEGAPYHDGRKVFLRTELVFHQSPADTAHDPGIGALFSKACYLTGESVFAPHLARHADAYYDRVAAAHWNGPTARGTAAEPYVHKRFRGVDFVANGYDFWFARHPDLSLAECAAITLLDYFNCTLGGTPFRDACESTVIEAADADWIPAFLADRRHRDGGRPAGAVAPFDTSMFFPEPEETDDACCPFHSWHDFDATRHDEIVDLHRAAQTFAAAHITPAPILMLGQDVVLDPEKFLVHGNQIHVLGREPLAPVNFAACWNSGGTPTNYLDVAHTVGAAHFLVPPILFADTDDCHHLRFDFFRNTWMVAHRQVPVPVPRIRNLEEMDFCPDDWDTPVEAAVARPWLDAVDLALLEPPGGRPGTTVWWADPADGPLVEEIREHHADKQDRDC